MIPLNHAAKFILLPCETALQDRGECREILEKLCEFSASTLQNRGFTHFQLQGGDLSRSLDIFLAIIFSQFDTSQSVQAESDINNITCELHSHK